MLKAQLPNPVASTETAAPAEGEETTAPSELPTREGLEALKTAVVDEIHAVGGTVSPSGVVTEPETGSAEADLAQAVITRIDAQLAMLRARAELADERREVATRVQKGAAQALPAASKPLGFAALDEALDQEKSAQEAYEQAEVKREESLRTLADAERRVENLERRFRLESAEPQHSAVDLQSRHLRWQLPIARQEVGLEQLRLALAKETVELRGSELDYSRSVSEAARRRLTVAPIDLTRKQTEIDERSQQERELLVGLDAQLDDAHGDWVKVRDRGSESAPQLEAERSFLHARLDVIEDERQIRLARLEALAAEAEIWHLRYVAAGAVADGSTRAERVQRLEELERELDRQLRAERQRADELQRRRRQLTERNKELKPEAQRWVDRELEVLAQGRELSDSHLDNLRSLQSLVDRTQRETRSESARSRKVWTKLGANLQDAWQWELISIENEPITAGKVLLALLLVILGYAISKRVSRSLAVMLMERFHVSQGTAHALQSFVFYIFVTFFFLWGFHLVGIPLTVFTLLGGVVAIGVGFGSQNVVNNFISGLILLAERPIKVGDLVDVDGVLGIIERIGLRSTRVRAGNNTHIFVPNSSFLEKNVLNWTSSDDLVRSSVDVGVAYGSPVETVKTLMLEALGEEPLVVKSPGPEVLFMEFGDNALLFRGYFWHQARQGLDPLRVQSAIRFRIDALFAEADLVIAYPQRDVHLDTLSPLRIELLEAPKPPPDQP